MQSEQPSVEVERESSFRSLASKSLALVMVAALAIMLVERQQTGDRPLLRIPGVNRGAPAELVRAGGPFESVRSEVKPMNAPAERAEFHVRQRLPLGARQLPLERLHAEYEQILGRERRRLPAIGGAPGGITGWKWLGPGNVGGRTRAMVINPVDPDVMYAGGVAGGVWKTTDGGGNWNPTDDFLLNLAVCALAIDPTNPNVLYAGTGEGWFSANVFVQGLGIFKSTDAGASWTFLTDTSAGFEYVQQIVISPNDSNRLYAGTRTGVWRSDDAGATWDIVLANPTYASGPSSTVGCIVGCTDLVVRNDTNPDTLFAAFGSLQSDGLYRSSNGGDSWLQYSVPTNQGRCSIALAPSDQDTMYLLMADNGTGGALGQLVSVFRSLDGGNSFTSQVDFGTLMGPWLLSNLSTATDCIDYPVYSQGWYDNVIEIDPVDPDSVWVGGVDLFRSTDGGVNWQITGYWQLYVSDPDSPNYVHADHHGLYFHPDYDGASNQTLFATSDGGIYRTLNAQASASDEDCLDVPDLPLPTIAWQSMNNGYGVTQFYHGDSARDGFVYVGGAQDNGTNRVQALGAQDDWDLVFGGDGGYVAIDPTDGQTMYVEYQGFPTIQKSTDGGDSFVEATSGITDTDGIFITPFAIDESDPQNLWTGGSRPWRTTDGAVSWQVAGPNFVNASSISAIAIWPEDGNVVYLGFSNGYVARTTNGLAGSPSWQVFSNGLVGAHVSSVAIDPVDPDIAYASYSTYGVPHILQTLNGGQSWASIDGIGFAGVPDIPVHWITVRPCNPLQLYAATELGVFASDDGGATWEPSNDGLAHVVVESLDWRGDNELVAFTHGRGAFRTRLLLCDPPRRPATLFPR